MLDIAIIVKVVAAYVAVSQGSLTHDYCARFSGSWISNPPGVECSLVVACNGGPLPLETSLLFDPIGATFMPRVNDPGFDISAFQQVAAEIPCDMLVCLGESVYFHRPGWLSKMVDAWNKYGEGMYGFFASYLVSAHMNTTAFCVSPWYLREYPKPRNHDERYNFEHGSHALWRGIQAKGRPTKLVTATGCFDPWQWRLPTNGLWRGNQSDCLLWASHTDRYFAADANTKRTWAALADQPFK